VWDCPVTVCSSFRGVANASDPSAFEDALDSLVEYRGDSLTEDDRDEIVETIVGAYETFVNRTL